MGEALLLRKTKLEDIDSLEVGEILTTARTINDSRFVICSGQTVYSTTYPELYTAIKDKFYQDSSDTSLYKYDFPSYTSTADSKYMKVSS